jgi:hypothetical protein
MFFTYCIKSFVTRKEDNFLSKKWFVINDEVAYKKMIKNVLQDVEKYLYKARCKRKNKISKK